MILQSHLFSDTIIFASVKRTAQYIFALYR
jgi:hypothetical protein